MEKGLIQSGQRRPWAMWLVVFVAAIAAGLLFFPSLRGRDAARDAATILRDSLATDSAAAVEAVNAFAAFATDGDAAREAARDHSFTATGMRRLAAALDVIVLREASIRPVSYTRVGNQLRRQADTLQRDPRVTTHADVTRAAFTAATAAIADIQQFRYPELAGAVDELREAAHAIRPDRLLLDQLESVQRFFSRASDVLRGMVEVGL